MTETEKAGRDIVQAHLQDREHPTKHFARVAMAWSHVLGHEVSAAQVCRCMIELKKAREAHKHDEDNLVDIAGYEQCLLMIGAASEVVTFTDAPELPLPFTLETRRFTDINVPPPHPLSAMAREVAQRIARLIHNNQTTMPPKITRRVDIANAVLDACEAHGVLAADGSSVAQELPSFVQQVLREAAAADQRHSVINSLHQGFGILMEEVDEFWDWVRARSEDRDPVAMQAELVQIAATALRVAALIDRKHQINHTHGE